ncbi:MAG: stage II sporulation protein M [Bacilli bacterium]|nr:stage II sporulation protein M [Bacilli bacterium]
MRKYMDKLKSNIRINKNLFVFLLVIVIVGIVSGSLFSTIIDAEDKKLVLEYLNSFFANAKEGKLNYDVSIINTLVFTVGFAIIMWLLGVSIIGFFIVIFMLFMKGFILGFSVSSIITGFGFKGLLLSLVYAFPHHIINILVFMLLTAYALIISFKLIRSITSKKPLDLKRIMHRYVMVLGVSVVLLIITSLYEIYIVPKLLNVVMGIIK